MKTVGKRLGEYGLYLFAVSIPVSFVPAQWGIALAGVGWVLQGLPERSWPVRWHPFLALLLFYTGWNILAALTSERPVQSLLAVGDNEWPAVLMLLMFWLVGEERILKRLIVLFLGSSSVAMAYGIWQTFGGVEFYRGMDLTPYGGFYRNVGFYGFYLTFAAFAMTVFFLATGISVHARDRNTRRMALLVAVLSTLAIIGSFARSIWLGMVLVGPFVGFFKGKKAGLISMAVTILLAAGAILLSPEIRQRAESMIDPQQNETRLNLWRTSLAIARENPVLGVGEDNFVYVFERYRVEGYYDTIVHPHNDYLDALVSSGIPGLLAFVALWGMALRSGYRVAMGSGSGLVRGISMGATLGLAGLLVGSFFQNYYGTFANCLGWWFLVGLLFVGARLEVPDHASDPSTPSS
ncbi:MAG: O-antigen ligase family protein [Ignavibacterium sp.]|jgi:O-antigen ligase